MHPFCLCMQAKAVQAAVAALVREWPEVSEAGA